MAERIYTTVGKWLDRVAQERPGNEALVHHQRQVRYTYRSFSEEVDRLAWGLMALGLQKGDPVALWGPNLPEWVLAQFALAKIGAVLVALDPSYGVEDLQYALAFSQARALLTAEGPDGAYLEMIRSLVPELWESPPRPGKFFPDLQNLITLFSPAPSPLLGFQEVLTRGEEIPPGRLAERERTVSPEDPLMILFTSGTTGKPKGVVLDHLGVMNKSMASTERLGITHQDRLCLFFPLFHMFGNTCIALAGLLRGAALVIPSDQISPPEILSAIGAEKCTAIYGSPSMMVALMESPQFKDYRPGNLRTGIIGGAPCPLEIMKRVVHEMGVGEIAIAYGITEASSWIAQTLPEDPLELRVSTIGQALSNCEVKIIDPAGGDEVPDGTPGEICTRGYLMKGYFKNPEATARAIDQEGWFHTGDLGTRDSLGYFRITGRLKEVILKEGREILPPEIEDALYRLPGVSMVQAFGVPDPEKGEVVALWIKPKEGHVLSEEMVAAYCRDFLPKDCLPDYIRLVEAFPMTRSGKIQKFKMRELMVGILEKPIRPGNKF
jgi:fatty-acyl-CoA synthase